MNDYCQCGIPKLEGESCAKCNKMVNPDRIKLLRKSQSEANTQGASSTSTMKTSVTELSSDVGTEAAQRVFRYGTLFENIGAVLQIVSTAATLIALVAFLLAKPEGGYLFLGLIGIGLVWCLAYLQTSLIRGLASYFQMRSVEFTERRKGV